MYFVIEKRKTQGKKAYFIKRRRRENLEKKENE